MQCLIAGKESVRFASSGTSSSAVRRIAPSFANATASSFTRRWPRNRLRRKSRISWSGRPGPHRPIARFAEVPARRVPARHARRRRRVSVERPGWLFAQSLVAMPTRLAWRDSAAAYPSPISRLPQACLPAAICCCGVDSGGAGGFACLPDADRAYRLTLTRIPRPRIIDQVCSPRDSTDRADEGSSG